MSKVIPRPLIIIMIWAAVPSTCVGQIRADGPGSVAIGQMSGGQVILGPTRDELRQLLRSATTEQEGRIRDAIASRSRADQALASRLERLLVELPRLARGLSPAQLEKYSENMAREIQSLSQRESSQTAEEFAKLNLQIDRLLRVRDVGLLDPAAAGSVRATLAGNAGDAIASLAFENAHQLLLAATRTEKQIEALQQDVSYIESSEVAQLSYGRYKSLAGREMRSFEERKGIARCPKTFAFLAEAEVRANQAASTGKYRTAAELSQLIAVTAMSAANELQLVDHEQANTERQIEVELIRIRQQLRKDRIPPDVRAALLAGETSATSLKERGELVAALESARRAMKAYFAHSLGPDRVAESNVPFPVYQRRQLSCE